jgi:molybdate transport system substrate-binding protein
MQNRFLMVAGSSVALLAVLLYFAFRGDGDSTGDDIDSGRAIELYCAMGINQPVRQILADYEKRYRVKVTPIFAGSGELMGHIKASGAADLYLAADKSYNDKLENTVGIAVKEILLIGHQYPVIAVHRGNPHNIKTIDDIVAKAKAKKIRLYLADPKLTAISEKAQGLIGAEQWDRLWQQKITARPTVSTLANDIALEKDGVGIIWNTTAKQYDKIDMVDVPEFVKGKSEITIAVVETSKRPTSALRLARFMTARNEGLKIFEEHHYDVVQGDVWPDGNPLAGGKPEILVFAGGLNQEAVKATIAAFEKREGVDVICRFEGCGALTGYMKPTGQGIAERPDVYFSCATAYMSRVEELFWEPVDVSQTDMVIAVAKGNKHQITGLADLAKQGIKVGLCNKEKSALGGLAAKLLEKHGIYDDVRKNTLDFPVTAPALVSKVATGALDAAIVYRANATAQSDRVEIIAINDPDAVATQPIAVGRESKHYYLSWRLINAILSNASRDKFLSLGFRWHGGRKADAP